jgi:hypothetical protein
MPAVTRSEDQGVVPTTGSKAPLEYIFFELSLIAEHVDCAGNPRSLRPHLREADCRIGPQMGMLRAG